MHVHDHEFEGLTLLFETFGRKVQFILWPETARMEHYSFKTGTWFLVEQGSRKYVADNARNLLAYLARKKE